jgi:integrase
VPEVVLVPTSAQGRPAARSRVLAAGRRVDLKSVMDRLGHAHIQTTQKFLHSPHDCNPRNLDALDRATGRNPEPPS